MKKKIIFAALAVAVLLVVLTTVEMVQSGQWHDSAMLVVVVVPLLAIQFYAVARQKPVKSPEEIDDDDGSIDWREENVDGEIVDVWNGWAVLLHDVPVHEAKAVAERNGVSIRVENDPKTGVKGANVLYTDVWVSMGEEDKTAERIRMLRPYQINMELMAATGNLDGKLMFLHCLPAFHDFNTEVTKECGALEVTDEVFESKYSKVFEESENRMHTIKALLVSALCDREAI